MALAVTADTAAWPHETDGVVFASLEEQKTLWWCRDGGLAQASSKIVRVALDRGGRAAVTQSHKNEFIRRERRSGRSRARLRPQRRGGNGE